MIEGLHPIQIASVETVVRKLHARGVPVSPGDDLPDLKRVYVSDPFGNRIELLELR